MTIISIKIIFYVTDYEYLEDGEIVTAIELYVCLDPVSMAKLYFQKGYSEQ